MRPGTMTVLTLAALAPAAQAQLFTPTNGPSPTPPTTASVAGPRPILGSTVVTDHDALTAALAAAPDQRFGEPLTAYGLRIALPAPDGTLITCAVASSPVMDPALGARYPQLRTYIVQTLDGWATGRLETAPRGMTAFLRTLDGQAWFIDPAWSADPSTLTSYFLRDLPNTMDLACHTDPAVHGLNRPASFGEGGFSPRTLQDLRTARVALACTGEYGLHHSTIQGHAPNRADPLAAIVTVITRANVVYEADLAVHFNLVPDEDQVVFFNPDTDPFPTTCDGLGGADCSSPILNAVPGALSANLTSTWDIAHCLTRVAGGVAYLWDVCSGNGGVSGIPRGGDIDPFSALVIIHEMGHQFGANHAFSGTRGRCGNNANLPTAWEAGSGSSPMAYAGGCPVGDAPPSDNIVQFADPFFHHGSLEEMNNFLPFAGCLAITPTANHDPEFTAVTPNQPIPPGTPFTLSASATDADGDPLSFSWEQFDNGARRPLSGDGSEDTGVGALFRIFPPTPATNRTFPRMADILAGTPTPGERLPTITGVTRQFRAVVRDNHPAAGSATISPMVTLTIQSNTSPFTVTAPAQGASFPSGPGHTANVSWTVGRTNTAPISAAQVAIRLSTDNGATFPTLLGTFPNNGSATITFPVAATTSARLRLDPVGKIFFAVSRPFTLTNPCPADFNLDGFLDFFDYDGFVSAFETGDPRADFNGDGFADFFDYDDFVGAFETGC